MSGNPWGRGGTDNDVDYEAPPDAPAAGGSASDTMAALHRDQWADYLARFAPLEIELRDSILSGERLNNALGRANTAVGTQYKTAAGTMQRNNARFGLLTGMTDAQQRQFDISRASTSAAINNRTRQQIGDSNMGLMAGIENPGEES